MAIIRIRNQNTNGVALYSEAVGYGRTTNYTKTGNGGASYQSYGPGYYGSSYGYTYSVDTKSSTYPPIILVKLNSNYVVHVTTPYLVSGTTWAFSVFSFQPGTTTEIHVMVPVEPTIYVYTPYHVNAGDTTNARMLLRNQAGALSFSDVRQTLFCTGSLNLGTNASVAWPNETFPSIPFATGNGEYFQYTPSGYELIAKGIYGLTCNSAGTTLLRQMIITNKEPNFEYPGAVLEGGPYNHTIKYLKSSLIV